MTHFSANRQPIATIERVRSTNRSLVLLRDSRSPQDEWAQTQCPRNRNGCRVVTDLVITCLIFQRAAERNRVLATERSLSLRCALQYDFLNEREWSLVNRYTF